MSEVSVVPSSLQILGMDQSLHPIMNDPRSYYDLKNVEITSRGTIKIRRALHSYFWTNATTEASILGYTGISRISGGSLGVGAFGMYQYGTRKNFWALTGYRLYSLYRQNWTANLNPFGFISEQTNHVVFNRYIIFCPQRGGRLVGWTGAARRPEALQGAPLGSCASVHYNRLIVAGDPNEPDAWYASFPNDPNNWQYSTSSDPDAGGFKATIPGNCKIVAISPSHYGGFYIIAEDSIHYVEGRAPSEYTYRIVSGSIGNIGQRTLKNIGNNIFGWNEYGCHMLLDTDKSGGISSVSIPPTVQRVFNERVLKNPVQFFSVNDVAHNCYITFMPALDSASKTIAMVYYYTRNQWVWWEFNRALLSAEVIRNGHEPTVLVGDNTRMIYALVDGPMQDAYEDYNLNFDVVIQTQKIRMNENLALVSNALGARVWHYPRRNGTMTLTITVEGDDVGAATSHTATASANISGQAYLSETATFVLGTGKFIDDNNVSLMFTDRGGTGRYITGKISGNASTIGPLEILGIQFTVTPSGGSP